MGLFTQSEILNMNNTIEGIDVLDVIVETVPSVRLNTPSITLFIVSGFIIIIFIALCVVPNYKLSDNIISLFSALLCVTIFLGLGFVFFGNPPIEKTYYRVLIDDNVSITEFTERYDIIRQEGKTFIVQEKNDREGNT